MPQVSIVIPVYKAESYITATVQSVLAQTFTDWELLIVSDGCPDRSIDLCRQFADPRIRILEQPNQGVCAARNYGIREAQGQYLAFLDADDLWHPEKLAKQVALLARSPLAGVCFTHSAFIDEAGHPLGLYQFAQVQDITPALILCRNPVGNGSTPLIRRQTLEGIRFQSNGHACYFDESLHHIEDIECWLRIRLRTGWEFVGIPEPLTLYRVTSTGASGNLERQFASLERVLQKTQAYAPDLVAEYGDAAKAYQLRFLARRAVRLKAAKPAVSFAHRAIRTHWPILIKEPQRTLLTLAGAYSLWLLPQSLYHQLEGVALKLTGASQRRRLQATHSSS